MKCFSLIQANGLDERFNQTLLQAMLVKCVNTKQTDWDEAVDSCVFAYNTSRHETTTFTPYELMLGRKAYLPVDVKGSPDKHLTLKEVDYSTEAIEQQFKKKNELLVAAKEKIKAAQVKQKHYYDLKRYKPGVYTLGSQVLLKDHRQKKRKGGKLQFRWLGPFCVTKKLNKGLYVITDAKNGKSQWSSSCTIPHVSYHMSQFKPNRSRSPHHSRTFSPHHSRTFSPHHSRTFSPHRSRSFSPHRSRSFSPHRSRSFSPHRSRSFSPYPSRSISPHRSRSFSPHRFRSFSPHRSRSFSPHHSQPEEMSMWSLVNSVHAKSLSPLDSLDFLDQDSILGFKVEVCMRLQEFITVICMCATVQLIGFFFR